MRGLSTFHLAHLTGEDGAGYNIILQRSIRPPEGEARRWATLALIFRIAPVLVPLKSDMRATCGREHVDRGVH